MFCYKYDFWHCVFISGGCDLGVLEGIADATVEHLFKPLAKGKFTGGGIFAT